MGKKGKTVRLIRGASYVVPGYRFEKGKAVVVPDELAEKLKRTQQFSVKDADEVDEAVDDSLPEAGEDSEPEAPPKKKKKKKR